MFAFSRVGSTDIDTGSDLVDGVAARLAHADDNYLEGRMNYEVKMKNLKLKLLTKWVSKQS